MKKFLSLVSALALVLPLLAGTVTFKPGDFAGQGTSSTGSAVSVTKGGVTLSCDKGFGSTSALRCYKNGVVTITSETKISTIDFSFETASGQTYNGGLDAQVTVNDMSWTNTLASQARFTEVVVTIEGEGVAPEKVDTISVTQALARIEGGVLGECYVKGKVLSIITNNVEQYGNISYWMADIDNPNDSLQAYRMKGAENKNYASAADIEFVEGDEILVYAAGLAMYHNNNTNVDIPELNTGYYVRTLKGKEIVTLDWAFGSAYRGANQWTLEILKANNDKKNALNLVFQSSKTDAIAGYHTLAAGSEIVLNGAKSAIASGSVKLTFKKIGDNSLNVYDVQATLNTADKAYRLNQEVEFYASDEESGDEIVLKGDRPFTPTEGQEITCAQAREYALSLPQGSTGEVTVTVHGYITDLFNNGITFWMADQKGEEKVFQSYLTVVPAGKALENGLEVKVTGKVTNYNGTPEISKGQLEFVGDAPDVQTIPVTVAQAIEVAQGLDNNAVTKDFYKIEAYIAGVAYAYSADFGNISLWLTDTEGDGAQTFQAYRAKCDAAIADKLVDGAKVVVIGNIKKQYDAETTKDDGTVLPERTIYEIVNGTVELYGTGVDDVTTATPAVKRLENGQIIIIRNGVRYNLQGQIAE